MSGFRVRPVKGTPLWSIGAGYYSPKLNASARRVPGVRFDSELRAHVGYPDAIELVVERLREDYKLRSEDAPSNTREWPHNLLVSYDGARDYQKAGIDFLVNQASSGALLADDMGCVDGEAIVNFAIDRRLGTASLSMLYRMFTQDSRAAGGTGAQYAINALCGDELGYQPIRAMIDKGWRPVLKLTFESGETLRLTADHEVALASNTRPAVFKRADELTPGEYVISGQHVGDPEEAAVASIKPDGEAHVYDIVCEDPHRNFVANGIIVHNCGKSLQAAKAARALRRKTVIVCPAHVRGVWERPADPALGEKGGELAKWWPKARVFRPYGITPEPVPMKVDVVVCHYDIVHAWVESILAWADGDLTAIFDEAQVLLNPESRRSLVCKELAHAARGRIALTGTPPVERVRDLFNIVDTISPGRFGETFFGFGRRYCDGQKRDVPGPDNTIKTIWTWDGKSNIPELRRRLDWFCLRRTKREVLKELPALQRQVVDVDVPARNRIGLNARLVGDKRRMRMALDSAADGKFKSVLELVKSHLEAGTRVVVGTYRRAVCERISEEMGEYAPTSFIHGGIPITRRDKIIDKLRKTEGPCCLVANIDCTSTGIDLTFASVAVVAEFVWEARDHAQFESRCILGGQLVHTLRGFLPIEDVRVGDEVLTHKGRWRRVLKVSHRSPRNPTITSIRYMRYSEPLTCTADHKLLVRRGARVAWIEAQDVRPRDYLMMPRSTETVAQTWLTLPEAIVTRRNTPKDPRGGQNYKPLPAKVRLSLDLLRLFGWYAAEGWAVKGGIGLAGHKRERPILTRLARFARREWGFNYRFAPKSDGTDGIQLNIYSKDLSVWFATWFGKGAHEKRFPPELMRLSVRQSRVLLDAYIDGDGYRRGGACEWVSVSPTLAAQAALLASRCGRSATLRRINNTGKNNGQWIGGYSTRAFRYTSSAPERDDCYVYQYVHEVSTKVGAKSVRVYDLTVDVDHSFVVGQAAVHNCHRFGQENSVLVQYVVARGTGDELILHAVVNKLDNFMELIETDAGDGLKETLAGKKDEGLTRLAAALKKMGKKSAA